MKIYRAGSNKSRAAAWLIRRESCPTPGTVIAARITRRTADLATHKGEEPEPCAAAVPGDLSPIAVTRPVDPTLIDPTEPSS